MALTVKTAPSVAVLKKRLTTVFNMFIRLRDKDLPCISCGQPLPFIGSHAGHFVPSTYTVHRFNEFNVNKQCPSCNLFRHGNLISYFIGMERKYGPDVPRELEATKFTVKKYTTGELLLLIEQYKRKVKEMS
jgi:hypothetical protein